MSDPTPTEDEIFDFVQDECRYCGNWGNYASCKMEAPEITTCILKKQEKQI